MDMRDSIEVRVTINGRSAAVWYDLRDLIPFDLGLPVRTCSPGNEVFEFDLTREPQDIMKKRDEFVKYAGEKIAKQLFDYLNRHDTHDGYPKEDSNE